MKVLVTGAKGFIGRNLVAELKNRKNDIILEYDLNSSEETLDKYTKECDFVVHLAGVNRPKNTKEFMEGNYGFTTLLLEKLKTHNNKAPVLITSSIQAELDNPYGKSKKEAEEFIFNYGKVNNVQVYVYRLTNAFGKWCRPNYNSVVATFCHNITHDMEIQVNNPDSVLDLVYIDDIVDEIINAMTGHQNQIGKYCMVPISNKITVGRIAQILYSFKESRKTLEIPNMGSDIEKKLYSTYLSYLPTDKFSYPLKMNKDARGSFTEIIHTSERGQVSVNKSNPGITKGNHWHHTKNEKFVVVSGRALIQFRRIDSEEVIEYHVSGDNIEVVDIPVGYTHNIINEGNTELITFMWANETFNSEKPDTFYMIV